MPRSLVPSTLTTMDDWQKFIAVAETRLDQEWAAATDWVNETGFKSLMEFLQLLNQTDGSGLRDFSDDQLSTLRNFSHVALVEAMKRVAQRRSADADEENEAEGEE